MKKYDIEYMAHVYITARGVEANSEEEAIEKADEEWHGEYPVVTEPSESAPWLQADDIHVSKDWEVSDVAENEEDESGS